MSAARSHPTAVLPSKKQILDFIERSREPVGKREIAREFGIRGPMKVQLRAMLKDMADEGLIDSGPGRAFHKMGGVPKVTVLKVAEISDESAFAVPENWVGAGPPPRLRVIERGRRSALGIGDRILARTEERGEGLAAHPVRKLESRDEEVIGVLARTTGPGGKALWMLRSVDKRLRRDWPVNDTGGGEDGELVLAVIAGRPPRQNARVIARLGDALAPRALSLIAIHKYGLPHVFPEDVEVQAAEVARLSIQEPNREDLTQLPIVAIDPADARDHDDAIWAQSRDDGGFDAIVAIADVSHYVRPGSAIDREARRRGNSVYFPDRVVPMLPHSLSSGACSLKAGEDRAAMVAHLTIDRNGRVSGSRISRAVVRLAANIAYEQAQAAIDGTGSEVEPALIDAALRPLWACWQLLAKARNARAPLDLDLPERQIILDETGRISEVRVRERLDAHQLVEDFMIAANVATAKALESRKSPVMYRVHEPPAREKLIALKEFLATHDVAFALGQTITPALFNRLLARFEEPVARQRVMEQILRSQTQAYYSPVNAGHFGLALGSYGHFTSPIRRYADLLVHRALVTAFGLDVQPGGKKEIGSRTGLPPSDAAAFGRIGEAISQAERRAMEAERETIDRYVAAYLSERVGEILETRISGVQSFGFFAQVIGLGGEGLVPVSSLGREYFRWDESSQTLTGEHSGTRYAAGQTIALRLIEANPLTGGLMFALPDVEPAGGPQRGRAPSRSSQPSGRRSRPAHIRHRFR